MANELFCMWVMQVHFMASALHTWIHVSRGGREGGRDGEGRGGGRKCAQTLTSRHELMPNCVIFAQPSILASEITNDITWVHIACSYWLELCVCFLGLCIFCHYKLLIIKEAHLFPNFSRPEFIAPTWAFNDLKMYRSKVSFPIFISYLEFKWGWLVQEEPLTFPLTKKVSRSNICSLLFAAYCKKAQFQLEPKLWIFSVMQEVSDGLLGTTAVFTVSVQTRRCTNTPCDVTRVLFLIQMVKSRFS